MKGMNLYMKKKIFILTTISLTLLLSACGRTHSVENISQQEMNFDQQDEVQSDYVVNIDDSFNPGIDIDDTRKTLSAEEADFRNLKWGMTKDEVSYAQGTGYREPDENTMYYTRVREEEFPADAEYKFSDGKLVQGTFYITEDKTENPIEVDDFMELVNSLKNRFGEPQIADLVYKNESDTTEDTARQLELVKQGLLQFRTGWMLEDTELRVVMFPKGDKACIGLQYKQAGAQTTAN